ncbi:MAG: FAD binding domain-containing protein [Nocardioides sp.]|uniref:FAD binding domain-containing protein n=1 Tax=Nocardioides sp. TaxID=35761 RepID=UPI0039E59E17
MKPAPFAFARPESLAEALGLLAESRRGSNAKVLAGGQSLLPLLSMRLAAPEVLIDINALPGLDRIEADEHGVRIGALVRHSDLLVHAGAARVQPLLSRALRLVAHPTIRNRGTTLGSIVHADPAAEIPMVLRLLGGSVRVVSLAGPVEDGRSSPREIEREIGAAELFDGPMTSTVRADELALSAWFPALPAGSGVAIDEVARRHGDYALCGVAAAVSVRQDGTVATARAGYLSVCEVPTVVELDEPLVGVRLDEATADRALAAAGELALTRLDPADDIHATADYRAQLARTLTARVLRAAYDDAIDRTPERTR